MAKIGSKIVQENSQKSLRHVNPIKLAHMLFIHFKMWKHHKTMKIYQEPCDNFFKILARNFVRAGVQISQTGVCTANNA